MYTRPHVETTKQQVVCRGACEKHLQIRHIVAFPFEWVLSAAILNFDQSTLNGPT